MQALNGELETGKYCRTIGELASGTYLYRVRSAGGIESGRFVVTF